MNIRRHRRWRFDKAHCIETLEARLTLNADLVALWQAEDLSLTDGAIMDGWVDAVGGISARGAGQPRFADSQLAGRDAVRFDTADGKDSFRVDYRSSPMSGIDDFSMVVVFASTQPNLQGNTGPWFQNTALIDGSSLGLATDWGMSLNSSGQVAAGLGAGFGSPPVTVYSQVGALNDGRPHVVSVVRLGSQLSLRVDDSPVIRQTGASSAARNRELDMTFAVGTSGDRAFSGDVGQIRIYRGALADDQADQLHAELRGFYNNVAPVAQGDEFTIAEDTTLSIVAANGLLANDQHDDQSELLAQLVDPPSHGSLTLGADGSFVYLPDDNYFGPDTFTYRAVDVLESNLATVSIDVRAVYDPVVPIADSYRLVANELVSFDSAMGVFANDSNLDGAVLTAELVAAPQGELVLSSDGGFTYHSRGFTGPTSFSYRVHDGTSISQPVNVTLNVNASPQAAVDRFATTEDIVLRVDVANGVLANDHDSDGDQLIARLKTSPARGQIELQPDGSFVYQPDRDVAGIDLFSYEALDGLAISETVLVQIDIASVNDPPVAASDTYFALPDQTLSVNAQQGVLANDRDVDGTAITPVIVALPSNGDLQFSQDGSFEYRPHDGFTGEDRFRYQVTDTQDTSAVVDVSLRVTSRPIVISELMTRSSESIPTRVRATPNESYRGSAETYDWLEIHNLFNQPIDLAGMFLTDSRRNLTKWQFPASTVLPANGYLVVYASGLDVTDTRLDEHGRFHTNFKLDGDGEYLALTAGAAGIVWDFANGFPPQAANVSFGVNADLSTAYFASPTPGMPNSAGLVGWIDDVEFSVERGYFDEPFVLTLTNQTPQTSIRYTLDGTAPTEQHGLLYTEPIPIAATTTLRAAAFRDEWLSSNVVTHTYFFLDSVIRQPMNPVGYPTDWRRLPTDYGMSQNEADLPLIAGDPNLSVDEARSVIKQSLQSLPTLSIVLPAEDLFDSARGIYVNPAGRGEQWERAASVEYLLPDGTPGFQIDAGLRMIGFTSRDLTVTPKPGFRLLFRSEYGQGHLEYPFFGESSVDRFDTLMLRGNARDSWVSSSLPAGPRSRAAFMRDQWAKQTQAAMGQPATAGRFVHLYLNGIYWGIFNPTERPDAEFAAEHFGGVPADYDVVKFCCPHEVVDGDMDEWNQLLALSAAGLSDDANYQLIQGNRPDGTRDPNLPVLIDIDNFIDFVLLGQYHASVDWPGNYYVIRQRGAESTGFKFLTWDNDLAFPNLNVNSNKVRTDPGHPWWTMSPGVMDIALRTNAEYRLRFADRARQHLFHDGALTPQATATLWSQVADDLEPGLFAESARWGDYRRDVSPSGERALYTVQDHWRPTIDRMLEGYFPRRTDIVLSQLKDVGLYPDTEAAEFLIDGVPQYGGDVNSGARLALSTPAGTIYFTLDGSDPRQPGGALSASATAYADVLPLTTSLTIKARVLNGQEWSALSEAEFVVGGLNGDFDNNRQVNAADIDLLCAQIRISQLDLRFDLSGDGRVDDGDLSLLVRSVLQTDFGDSNLDGVFNSQDLVTIFQAGEYEDAIPGNSSWSDGDWNGDSEFDSSDLVRVFQSGSYVATSVDQGKERVDKRAVALVDDVIFSEPLQKRRATSTPHSTHRVTPRPQRV